MPDEIIHENLSGNYNMRQTDLILFFTMTFVIIGGILGLYIFASESMVRLVGSLTGCTCCFTLP
ncbi:MAG: hypothetical protein K9K63_10500 [Desulfotignum sp.]|nr:hypothetical protein [Desulfotignum sp.]MCF8088006.1 hypothetical protein [Desulfotignum sp.]MCF8137728.1 hypothetical protein [Desulfotignum sp.]